MTAEVIDLTLSPLPEPITIHSSLDDGEKRPTPPKSRKRSRKQSKNPNDDRKPVTSEPEEKPASTSQVSQREPGHKRRESDYGEPPLKSPRIDNAIQDLFFVDVTPIILQPALKPAKSAQAEPSDKESKLLLPFHVIVSDGSRLELPDEQPEDGVVEDEDFIEYLDYDDNRKVGLVRYFEEPEEEEPQPVKRVCRNCGGNHSSASCKVIICLICGARDEHQTRRCPISKTCFRCGIKGHVVSNCPNRGDYQGNYCERCGSAIHKTSDCPTLWRLYDYVSDETRLQILQSRDAKRDLELGEGGEGYVGSDIWCYNCGDCGHWGDDCKSQRRAQTQTQTSEPSAFSEYNTMSGPFYDQTLEPSSESTSRPRRVRDWEKPDFVDPKLPGNVGKEGRKKDRAKLEKWARSMEQQQNDEEDDWFARGPRNRSRSGGGGGSGGSGGGGHFKPRSRDGERENGRSNGKQPRFKMGSFTKQIGSSAVDADGIPVSQSLLDRIQMDDSSFDSRKDSSFRARLSKAESHRREHHSNNKHDRNKSRDREKNRRRERDSDRYRGGDQDGKRDKYHDDERRPPSGPQYKGGYSR